MLTVSIDSGPAFFVGDIVVKGLSRYSAAMVRNFSTLQRGQPYSQSVLDDYVRRLLGSGYFAGVQAAITTDPAQADADGNSRATRATRSDRILAVSKSSTE